MLDLVKNKLSLAMLPTPIRYMPNLSKYYGYKIYFKRDDLTGLELTGNKIRKLEYSFYEAKRQNADSIITCGGIQSNHARATTILCRRLGLEPYLVLRGSEPQDSYDGNLLLNKFLEAEIFWITPDEYRNSRNQIMEELADQLMKKGKTPYIIPEGASNVTGYLGYFNAGLEIQEQEKNEKIQYEYVFCPVGSGGTLGGLYLAKLIANWERKIIGVNVCDTAEFFQEKIKKTIDEFSAHHKLNIQITPKEIDIVDGFVGPGYAISTEEERKLIKMVARMEGIFLEPVYTGKAFWALDHLLKNKKIPQDSNILFIHTGGIFGLFPQKETFF
ncbi:MAG: 1-aminocyclopropane-1-carboxylate deaminase/D-cysteine desulfhydrase [Promethearchaeota archaeon]